MSQPPTLHDPEVYHSYLFVPGYELDPARMHTLSLAQDLAAGGVFDHRKLQDVLDLPPTPRSTVLFKRTDFRPAEFETGGVFHGSTLRVTNPPPDLEAEVRTLGDSYLFGVYILRPENHPDPKLDATAAPPDKPVVAQHHCGLKSDKFLGQFTLYTAQAVATADPVAEAVRYAEHCGITKPQAVAFGPNVAVVFDRAAADPVALVAPGARAVAVYREKTAVNKLFRVGLPELALYHLKVRASYRDLYGHDLGRVRELDDQLRDLLRTTAEPGDHDPDALLTANDRLTTLHAQLEAAVDDAEDRVDTARIAADNFPHAAAVWGVAPADCVALARELVGDATERMTSQAAASLRYRKRTVGLAKIQFDSLQATLRVHETRETRGLAKVMAILTCAQVAGVVATVFGSVHWLLGLALVLAFTGAMYAFVWWVVLRRPKR